MQTSARNQFPGQIRSIKAGPIHTEVILDIGGAEIVAVITHDSAERLALTEGASATALIKASWVILTLDEGVRTSARNQLCGTVVLCREGPIHGEVVVEVGNGRRITATVTSDSVRSLGLREGVRVCALFKASHVILTVPA